MKTRIQQLLDAFKNLKESSRSRIPYAEYLAFFHDEKKQLAISKIEEKLKLNDLMSVHELHDALIFIENIRVADKEGSIPLRALLSSSSKLPVLDEPYITPPDKKLTIIIKKEKEIIQLLEETHEVLFNYHEISLARLKGDAPLSVTNYDAEMLSESQAFCDLEISSQSDIPADESTIFPDIKRKGVTFENKTIVPVDIENSLDPFTIETIENFAGDKVEKEGARANKIYHFGGQILEATVLREFTNTAILVSDNNQIIERGKTKGHINWRKDPVTSDIYADVNIEIMTCVYADPDNHKQQQQFLCMGTDGSSLIRIENDDDLEKILKRCNDERLNRTENNVVPICRMNATFKLQSDPAGQYHIKADKFSAEFNTLDLAFENDNSLENSHISQP